MTEKTYKVMGLAGGANIAIGIISIVVGVTTGIILLVSGGKLLGAKKGLTFKEGRFKLKAKNRKRLRVLGKILFVLYIGFLFYFLIFSDWYGREGTGEYHYNLVLFCEIKRFWLYRDVLGWVSYANLFGNVLIFIPFGFFMPMASRYRSFFLTLFYSFGVSFFVECFQLVTRVGSFDVDDMLLNTLGGVIGYIVFAICNMIRRWHDAKQER